MQKDMKITCTLNILIHAMKDKHIAQPRAPLRCLISCFLIVICVHGVHFCSISFPSCSLSLLPLTHPRGGIKIEKLKISAPTSEGWNVSDIRHLLQLALQALHVGGRV